MYQVSTEITDYFGSGRYHISYNYAPWMHLKLILTQNVLGACNYCLSNDIDKSNGALHLQYRGRHTYTLGFMTCKLM